MGYTDSHVIRAAARYLLRILVASGGKIAYGDAFYDGSEETHRRAADAIGCSDYDDDVAEHAIDLAVRQLEGFGLVVCRNLNRTLPDELPDYEIELTMKATKVPLDLDRLPFRMAE